MSKIGMDFGTTYSSIAMIEEDGTIKECTFIGEGKTTVVDSLVVKDRTGKLVSGFFARGLVGKKNTVTFRGFKMMLAEDESKWAERNYSHDYPPSRIVEEYIGKLLEQYNISRKMGKNEHIETLVVGVPEIWLTMAKTMDCRGELKRIIESLGYVDNVKLVSEPAAACAYFAHNYKTITGHVFKGKILLIDYGGGTLDIVLCDVEENGESSTVKVIARRGAGWNSEEHLGKAGLAFIEEIVRIALISGGVPEKEILKDDKFYKCAYDVENALMAMRSDIEDVFFMTGAGMCDNERIDTPFWDIDYHDESYEITYGMLAKAYNTVCKDLLNEKLDEIIADMKKLNISYDASQKNFKIAMVGGFCNFYLTKKQIEEKFDYSLKDNRFQDIIGTVPECEKAIAFGTALIANDIIGFKQTAPCSLGLAAEEAPPEEYEWAIRKGEDVEYDKVKMFQFNGSPIAFSGHSIPRIAYNFGDDLTYAKAKTPLKKYQELLKVDVNKFYIFGYSLDDSLIITLHRWVVPNPYNTSACQDEERIVLDDIQNMMGGTIPLHQ